MTWKTCLLIAGLSLAREATAQTPCEWFDHNGDGFLGANTWLYVLGQFGTEGALDLDEDGWVDADDVLSFLPYFGHNCPVAWHDTTATPHLLGLVLVEWATAPEDLSSLTDVLPAGTVTYRLYAHVAEPSDRILGGFGTDSAPMSVSTDGEFFGFGSEGPDDSVLASDVNPLFYGFAPAMEFNTWLTLGEEPGTTDVLSVAEVESLGSAGASSMGWADAVGGVWFNSATVNAPQAEDGLILLGQFTPVGGTFLSGTLNLLLESYPDGEHEIERVEGLTFGTDDLSVLGCMDPEAANFNPEATFPAGPCFAVGDLDGDGEIGLSDFLELIEQFGCTDCPGADFNGDGVVSIQDILLFLAWL